jgi:hypothetical protein
MLKAKHLCVAVLFTTMPGVAAAYCSERNQSTFEKQVNERLEWLLCLHNEQVGSMNSHATMIDNNAQGIDRDDRRIRLLVSATADLANQVRSLKDNLMQVTQMQGQLRSDITTLRIENRRLADELKDGRNK